MRIERWQAAILVTALVFLLLAAAIEHPVLVKYHGGEYHGYLFNIHTISLILGEIAFALIIAFVISVGIERRARMLDNRSHEEMRKLIAEDVFKGVFAEGLPRTYVEAVIDRDLRLQLLRTRMKIDNDLDEPPAEIRRNLTDNDGDVVSLKQVFSFELENVAGRDVVEEIRFSLPIIVAELADATEVTRIETDGHVWTGAKIVELRTINSSRDEASYQWTVSIPRGSKVEIAVHAALFKRRCDNHIFSVNVPTMACEVVFRSSLAMRSLGLTARSAQSRSTNLIELEKGFGLWVLEGPLLTNDSVTLWWTAH